ncbi:MAG: DUF2029 domain-containing protein [Deltaproteobacteria bacterium]|nr:DUF2029 domain-containing protein [Deltaproteobacteria bacterium]
MSWSRHGLLGHPLTLVLLSLLATVEATAIFGLCQQRTDQWDFSHYYVSSVAARMGIDPYTSDLTPLAGRLGMKIEEINHATNPPSFVLAFELLTLLSPTAAYWVWFLMNLGALAFSLFLLLRDFPRDKPMEVWSLIALSIIYPPVANHFVFAQAQIFIMLMLLLMMGALRRGNDFVAGFMLAAASLLRIYPIILTGYLAVTNRRRALIYTIVFGILGLLLTASHLGIGRTLGFIKLLAFLTGPHWLGVPANVSLDAFISRMFWLAGSATAGLELARKIAVVSASMLLLLATVCISVAAGKNDDTEWKFSLWVAAMVLLSPTAWPHYLIFLLIPFSHLVIGSRKKLVSPKTARLGFISAASVFAGFYITAATHARHPDFSAVIVQLLACSSALAYIAMYSFGSDIAVDWPLQSYRVSAVCK